MPGCCLAAVLLFFGPRVALVFAWLLTDWYRAFDTTWLAVLGFVFLPWTSLAWMFTYFQHGGDISGGYILLFIFSVLLDLGAYGGAKSSRA